MTARIAIWGIAALATTGVILRPFRIHEAIWALGGACLLVGLGLLPFAAAIAGIDNGVDVYLFLIGMMLLAEVARATGLFDWLASQAAAHARGSPTRLFGLVYGVGILVTAFLSNDATAVVLTPAVAAVCRSSKVEDPLPYLLICAFIANAASFVLPIANPANLVVYAGDMPSLLQWVSRFALPSIAAIGVTFLVLRRTQRHALERPIAASVAAPELSLEGKAAAMGIVVTAIALLTTSAMQWRLGFPTCLAGLGTLALVSLMRARFPWPLLREISWGVIPLVAGLFVLVEGVRETGVVQLLTELLREQTRHSVDLAAAAGGVLIALASNLLNNLPSGLIAGAVVQTAGAGTTIKSAVLIGVDLGPNLSVTGSLATILWLTALRREGIAVKPLDFLKLGALVMPPALILSLATVLIVAL
jgi:arsenical pump membrane protein